MKLWRRVDALMHEFEEWRLYYRKVASETGGSHAQLIAHRRAEFCDDQFHELQGVRESLSWMN